MLSRRLAYVHRAPDQKCRGMVADMTRRMKAGDVCALVMPEVTRCKQIRHGWRCEDSGSGEQSVDGVKGFRGTDRLVSPGLCSRSDWQHAVNLGDISHPVMQAKCMPLSSKCGKLIPPLQTLLATS